MLAAWRRSNTSSCQRSLQRSRLSGAAASGLAAWLTLLPASSGAAEPSAAPSADAARAATQGPAWMKAYAQDQWSAAIELLETIPEPSRTAWHWLHLGRAREKRGQLVEAFAAYERLQDVAAENANAPGMKDAQQQARAESAALGSRIPWANVQVSEELPAGALAFVDQQWLEPSRLRSPYPVNPGWHTFLIESNGQVLAARRVHFEEGQSRLVPLATFEALARSGASMPSGVAPRSASRSGSAAPRSVSTGDGRAASPARAGASGSAERAHGATEPRRGLVWRTSDRQPLDARPSHDLLTSAYVSLGVGAAGALIGTGLAISALSARSDSEALPCAYGSCGSSESDRAWRNTARAATASYSVGLIGLATGGILWLVHREYAAKRSIKLANIELEPELQANRAVLTGTF